MALSLQQQAKWWGIGLIVALVFLWFVADSLAPFILGAAIAYLLDPIADKLESWGASRLISTILISVAGVFLVLLVSILIIPILVEQIQAFIRTVPDLFSSLVGFLKQNFPKIFEPGSNISQTLLSFQETLSSKTGDLLNGILSRSLAVVDFIMLLVVAPVVAFYLLLDWDRMIAVINTWIPREHAAVVQKLSGEINNVLAGFVRGQMTVGAILGIFYAIALAIVGLQFGIVVGLIAGALTFIPYVGSLVGGVTSIGLALFQFWDDPVWIGVVAAIFVFGQIIEGNFLTPKLVGNSVGLHPVWLMFALYAFGSLFGFAGMLIAVPAAACIGVLGRFGLQNYLQSKLYLGADTDIEIVENDDPDAIGADEQIEPEVNDQA